MQSCMRVQRVRQYAEYGGLSRFSSIPLCRQGSVPNGIASGPPCHRLSAQWPCQTACWQLSHAIHLSLSRRGDSLSDAPSSTRSGCCEPPPLSNLTSLFAVPWLKSEEIAHRPSEHVVTQSPIAADVLYARRV